MKSLDDIIREATAAIPQTYFLLPIDGGRPVYRERVYCYELYHRMRCAWGDFNRTLNGEVDKSGHALMAGRGIESVIPDLLVHGPGKMEENYAIIEVKGCGPHRNISRTALEADITKLQDFCMKADYQRALFLVYGEHAYEHIADRIRALTPTCPIELWLHPRVGEPARQIIVEA